MEHVTKNIIPLKPFQTHQIEHSLVLPKASLICMIIYNVFTLYQILIEENHLSVACEQVPSSVKSSAACINDFTKLDYIEDITFNNGESMTHHGQVLRQVNRDECCTLYTRIMKKQDNHRYTLLHFQTDDD